MRDELRPTVIVLAGLGMVVVWVVVGSLPAMAHPVGDHGAVHEATFFGFMELGTLHMVTGVDHLLFVAGIVVLVPKLADVVKLVTTFTVGHSITLLAASLAGWTVNARLIDALIPVSVAYIGVQILRSDGLLRGEDGHRRPALNPLVIVYLFGLLHGLGLATRLQALAIPPAGLVRSVLGFNLGVELGQLAALVVLVTAVVVLRTFNDYQRLRRGIGVSLIAAGVGICSYLTLSGIAA